MIMQTNVSSIVKHFVLKHNLSIYNFGKSSSDLSCCALLHNGKSLRSVQRPRPYENFKVDTKMATRSVHSCSLNPHTAGSVSEDRLH